MFVQIESKNAPCMLNKTTSKPLAHTHNDLSSFAYCFFHSFQLTVCLLLAYSVAEAKRVRVRTRPESLENEQLIQESESEEERRPVIQYYRAEPRADDEQRIVLVPTNSEEDYPDVQYQRPAPRPLAVARADIPTRQRVYQQAAPTTISPRRKDEGPREPPVQTIRNYNKVNDDGSFTFGYEAADGSFKEETRGTDCVVRGKYGYVDPDGNKREFTYVSGNPCDPNNPEGNDEEAVDSIEDSEENVPQNYPRRPAPRPQAAPRPSAPTTVRPPTTVFSNVYAHNGLQDEQSDEENLPQTIQIGQRPRPTPRQQAPQHVTQRPRVQIVNTTPTPTQYYHSTQPVSITPRPYKPQTNPPATTYKPPIQLVTQKHGPTTPAVYSSTSYGNPNSGNVDFEAEFKKFNKENKIQSSSPPTIISTPKQFKPSPSIGPVTNNPIYESQLIFDPSSGQYDTQLYQQLPQTSGDFSLNHRIQPYVHQPTAQPQLVNLQQFRAGEQVPPIYRHQVQHPQVQQQQQQVQQTQIPQQLYQKQQSELQFLNSQQLFAQQLEQQQSQLHRDRLEAAKKGISPGHRFEVRPSPVRLQQAPAGQQYYYIQPNAQGGQIDAFLRNHNVDF